MRYKYGFAVLAAVGVSGIAASGYEVAAQIAQNAPSALADVDNRPVGFGDLVQRLQPAVVNISATEKVNAKASNPLAGTPFGDLFGGDGGPTTQDATSLGSGFIISPNGYVVTNNHVLTGGDAGDGAGAVLQSVTVTLADRTEYKARIIGRDALADIAVLKIDAPQPFAFVRFGDSARARVGDWVIAVGNPFALGGTVTAGIISAIHRTIGDIGRYHRFIQTDAAINSGNSGGPLFNMAGEVVGINNIIQPSGGGGNLGIGFAIPAEEAKPVVDVLMHGGMVKRGYLGIGIQPIDDTMASALGLPKDRGEIVARVEPGYPAAKAGIQQGDVIVAVDGHEVTPDNTLTYAVSNLSAGTRIPIELLRRGSRMTVTAVVGERPPESRITLQDNEGQPDDGPGSQTSTDALGAPLQTLTPDIARKLNLPAGLKGVLVAKIDPDSNLATNGVKRGDVILGINQQPTPSAAVASAMIAAAKRSGRDSVLLLVQRGSQPPIYLGIKLKKD